MDLAKRKSAFEYAENWLIQIFLSICLPLNVLWYSVSGRRRPRSDCAGAQYDLGLRCPHINRRHIFAWLGSFTGGRMFLSQKMFTS